MNELFFKSIFQVLDAFAFQSTKAKPQSNIALGHTR